MLRMLLAAGVSITVLAAVATLGLLNPRPASAGGPAPWCAVVDIGDEIAWHCSYWTFEACVPHVLAGNRGFCEENPAFTGPIPRSQRRHSRHRYRR